MIVTSGRLPRTTPVRDHFRVSTGNSLSLPAGVFGTGNTPGVHIGTEWNTPDIWLVRDVELKESDLAHLQWLIHHDEDVEIYVNGELTEKLPGYVVKYEVRPLSAASKKQLKPGRNRLAVHCHQETGGQYIDLGMATIEQDK